MKTAITICLTAYGMGIFFLAYVFCYGDPGTLGGHLPFAFLVLAVPLSSALTFCATYRGE